MTLDLPETRLNRLYRAVLAQLFINGYGDIMPYGAAPSNYDGSVYDMAAFGESHSATITVIPHSLITQSIPAKAKHNVVFGVRAWLQPRIAAGPTNVTAEAYKKGTSTVLSFPATAFASKSGPTPLKASVTLPSAGTWYVRFHRTSDGVNADSATKWVKVAVS